MSRLGDLIKLERGRRNLTHRQLARMCGVGERFLQQVEQGTRIIRDDEARRILKAMGMEQEQAAADFSLDDIAATVDLQSALPQAQKAVEKRAKAEGVQESQVPISGSIWLDALSDVLRRVPIYNAVMKETGSRLLPVTAGRIEGAPKDSVYYFTAPDDSMRGFRVQRGDLVLVVPASAPEDGAMMLIEAPQGRMLKLIKLLPRFQVMLQSFDQAFESEIVNISDLKVIGRCVRLEAEL